MQVHILGTSSSRPAHGRSVSGSVVNTNKGIIVVDCGEGFQERFVKHNKILKNKNSKYRIKSGKINTILLTHGHLDHTWGLLPLLKTLSLDGREKELTVIAPTLDIIVERILQSDSVAIKVEDIDVANVDIYNQYLQWWSLGGTTEELNYRVNWILVGVDKNDDINKLNAISINPNRGQIEVVNDLSKFTNGIKIVNIPTLHSVPSCGWWIKEPDRRGKFDSEKARRNNLSVEQIKKLVNGEKIDGFSPKEFMMESKKNPSVLISGDTAGKNPGFRKFSNTNYETSVLIHEATFLQINKDRAEKYFHSTALEAAKNAKLIGAKQLIITHFSSRIKDTKLLSSEAIEAFERVHAASDSDVIVIEGEEIKINSYP